MAHPATPARRKATMPGTLARWWRRLRPTRTTHLTGRTPWWVNLLTDAGRPIVAVIVMVMCAPGEHHLGVLAGWSDRLAWGMAAVLAAYAGIAAAVVSKRPAGTPGRWSAILGAWLSLGAAMSAQPLSHLFVVGVWSAVPHAPVALIVGVSPVPPLVLGHLLHLAATPVPTAAPTPAETPVEDASSSVPPQVEAPAVEHAPAALLPAPGRPHDAQDADASDVSDVELLSSRQVADLLGVSPSTVRTWVQTGTLEVARKDARGRNWFRPSAINGLGGGGYQ